MFRHTLILLALLSLASPAWSKPTTAPADVVVDAWPGSDRQLPEVNFDAVGLSDVIDFLRDVSGANFFVNWKVLEDAGIDRTAPVSAKLRNVRFDKGLEIVLKSVAGKKKLAFKVADGVIAISTEDDLFGEAVSATYDIHFLFPEKLDPAERDKRAAALLKLITGSIDPASWGVHDGKARLAMELNGSLIVTQTGANQKSIATLITGLREMSGNQGNR